MIGPIGSSYSGLMNNNGSNMVRNAGDGSGNEARYGVQGDGRTAGQQAVDNADGKADKGNGVKGECQTCKNRKYQDGSNENVSFKSATHISPTAAGSMVRAHEGEHVSNAYDKAKENGGQVVRASVQIHTSVCPECGRTYVSGGVTSTTIKYNNEQNPYMSDFKDKQGVTLRGRNLDKDV